MNGVGSSEAARHTVASARGADAPVAVVAALPEELAGLRSRTRIARRLRFGRCDARLGRLGRVPVVLACTGDGRLNAEEGLRSLLERLPVSRLIVIGIAGGLSPRLAPGSIVVACRVLDGTIGPAEPDPGWVRRALAHGGARAGVMLTSPRILGTVAEKRSAWKDLGEDEAAVVDLETAGYASVAGEHGVPFIAVRAVSDAADEALPLDLNACRDRRGAVRRLAVARAALVRPRAIAPLWRLRRRVAFCSERLGRFVAALLDGGDR